MSNTHDHPHPAPAPASPLGGPVAPPLEDAGAQALDEALRSSFKVIKLLMILLVVVFIGSGMFTVQPNEVAVVLRFGKAAGIGRDQLLKPGLHFALPYPIDEIVRLPIGQSITVVSSNGWHQIPEDQVKNPPPFLRAGIDGYTLSGDGNIIHARATLKYRLQPETAVDYYFNFVNASNTLRAALENSLIYASSQIGADTAVYLNKAAFTDKAKERLSKVLDEMKLRINIEGALQVETIPPPMVQSAFDDVTKAQQTKSTRVNEAETYARTNVSSAIGEAQAILNEAITRSNQLVVTVRAEAKAFTDQLPFYASNPELFKQRLMSETMQQILPSARDKYLNLLPSQGELRLQLNREPLKPKD